MEEQIGTFETDLASYATYALSAQGKQLRPALVGLSANATGKIQDSHVTVAVIIEMVHLATLVHDDVLDGARIRRGRPTLAAGWGVKYRDVRHRPMMPDRRYACGMRASSASARASRTDPAYGRCRSEIGTTIACTGAPLDTSA